MLGFAAEAPPQVPQASARIGPDYEPSSGTRYVAVAGTHGFRDGWATDKKSAFATAMGAHGFYMILTDEGDPFQWSGDVNGILHITDWQAGERALAYFLNRIPYGDRNLICHSHGGQLALLYAAGGRKLRTLTTLGTPPRSDIPMHVARPNIGYWQHIYDNKIDWWGWLGQIGERNLNKSRRMPLADLNINVDNIYHSKVLRDPEKIQLWFSQGWAERIK